MVGGDSLGGVGAPGAAPGAGAPVFRALSPQRMTAARRSATAGARPRMEHGAVIRGRILANAGGRGYLPRMVRTWPGWMVEDSRRFQARTCRTLTAYSRAMRINVSPRL